MEDLGSLVRSTLVSNNQWLMGLSGGYLQQNVSRNIDRGGQFRMYRNDTGNWATLYSGKEYSIPILTT